MHTVTAKSLPFEPDDASCAAYVMPTDHTAPPTHRFGPSRCNSALVCSRHGRPRVGSMDM
jgi:hypothetical protein